jgi:hypothetical protein
MAQTFDRISIPAMTNGIVVRVQPIDRGREIVVLTLDGEGVYEWAIIGGDALESSDDGFSSVIAALHAAKDHLQS